jgi:hypothetical protein
MQELETSLAPVQTLPSKLPGTGIPPPSLMRTGGRLGVSTTTVPSVGPAAPSGSFFCSNLCAVWIFKTLYHVQIFYMVDLSSVRLTICVGNR